MEEFNDAQDFINSLTKVNQDGDQVSQVGSLEIKKSTNFSSGLEGPPDLQPHTQKVEPLLIAQILP